MENQKSDLILYANEFTTNRNKIISEFSKPVFENVFFNNLDLLRDNSNLIVFDVDKWVMRPEIFCNDQYDEPYLSYVIMLVNNIKSMFEFIPTNFIDRIIIAPTFSEIRKVLSYSL